MGLTQIVAPTTAPVTISEAKQHLRVMRNDEDALIGNLIASATRLCETYSGRQLVSATYALQLDDFPGGYGIIRLPRTPVQSVSGLTYVDADGTTQTLSTDYYELVTSDTVAMIVLKPGQTWPSVQSDKYGAVTVTFIAGYGAASAVPQAAKSAIKLLLTTMFNVRDAVGAKLEEHPHVQWLLDSIAVPKVI